MFRIIVITCTKLQKKKNIMDFYLKYFLLLITLQKIKVGHSLDWTFYGNSVKHFGSFKVYVFSIITENQAKELSS